MCKTRIGFQLLLGLLLALSMALAGCGGNKPAPAAESNNTESSSSAAEPTATLEVAAEPTAAPEAAAEPTEATTAGDNSADSGEITDALNSLIKLAPLHMTSSFESKESDQVSSAGRVESDVDAKGNQHTIIYDKDNNQTELYIVDKKMYLRTDANSDQYVAVDFQEDNSSSFAFLAMYGGAYLLGFNDMQDAKKVGSEKINGFQCDKYEMKMSLASLGVAGVAADASGADFNYQGNAWIEPNAKALIKAHVDWTSKAADSGTVETFQSDFEAKPGTVQEITAPQNVLTMDTNQ